MIIAVQKDLARKKKGRVPKKKRFKRFELFERLKWFEIMPTPLSTVSRR